MSALTRIAAFLAAAALSPAALAAEASMDKADVVWMLVSTTLVLFMTIPGIALFYGGMARKKNVLSILAQTTVICCALTLVWFAAGYSLAFGPGSAFVGGLSHVFLNGLDINSMSGSIPTLLFVCFQMTFAILTATLMIGAFAGRMKFSAMLIFMILWSLCVYSPVCHWVWAEGGFFFDMGALDYAGGTVVHINAGVSGLVACLVLGKRFGYGREPMSLRRGLRLRPSVPRREHRMLALHLRHDASDGDAVGSPLHERLVREAQTLRGLLERPSGIRLPAAAKRDAFLEHGSEELVVSGKWGGLPTQATRLRLQAFRPADRSSLHPSRPWCPRGFRHKAFPAFPLCPLCLQAPQLQPF